MLVCGNGSFEGKHQVSLWVEVKKLFGIVDNDGSNYIDRSEMATLLNNLGKSLSEEEIDEGFVKLDTDSSGQIDFEEFYSWYKDVAFGNKSD